MTQTINERRVLSEREVRDLEKLAREQEHHLYFRRHSPREVRWIPMVDTDMSKPVSWPEAVVWAAVCALFVAAMFGALSL